jgi:hypothetical protein
MTSKQMVRLWNLKIISAFRRDSILGSVRRRMFRCLDNVMPLKATPFKCRAVSSASILSGSFRRVPSYNKGLQMSRILNWRAKRAISRWSMLRFDSDELFGDVSHRKKVSSKAG